MQHLLGALQKPALAGLRIPDDDVPKAWKEIIKESAGEATVGDVFLWHPSGRPIEIRVVAGKRAGGSAISRWLLGVVFDEAPRMIGEDEGVVNYDDTHRAALGRLLPGGIVLSLGSPWRPVGPIYDAVEDGWGNPTPERVVIVAKAPWLNPVWWNEARCAVLKNRPDQSSQIGYQTDVLAQFADLAETLLPQSLIQASTREKPLVIPYEERHNYVAHMDPATRRNAWTLVVADRVRRVLFRSGVAVPVAVYRIVLATQWVGTPQQPLSPRTVLGEIASILRAYHLNAVTTDQWSVDAIRDIASERGIYIAQEEMTTKEQTDAYMGLATAMQDGVVELPPDVVVQKDLRLTKRITTQKGIAIRLTDTTDGRHCDYSPSIVGATHKWIELDRPLKPKPGEPGYFEMIDNALDDQDTKRYLKTVGTWANAGMIDTGDSAEEMHDAFRDSNPRSY
jgi:hypothetical protein